MSKIAIIDDAPIMHKLVRSYINEDEHEIFDSDQGKGAIKLLLQEENISTLFLDLVMPDIDGFQVLETINAPNFKEHVLKHHPNLKIVLMTSKDSQEIRNKAFSLGAANFISKPFTEEDILKVVDASSANQEQFSDVSVLVTEDSNLTRSIITTALKPYGINIIEANDGDIAFDYLQKNSNEIDLVITDLIMERMHGDTLCKKIRQELELTTLPVIFLTAVDDNSTILDLFKAGATDYIQKPFIMEELISRLKVHFQTILLNKRLKGKIDEQEQLLELKDEFLAVCSHDLRSPLTGILGFAGELEEQVPDKDHQEMAGQISTSGNYLLSLINDILDLGKSTANKSEKNFTAINLVQVINSCINSMQASAKKKDISLSFNFDKETEKLRINGEEVSIIRIFTNLISNSLKFTEENGAVALKLEQQGDKVTITVKDNGIGIPKDKIPVLFDKYTSASQEGTAGEKSTGLGMSIIKTLVEIHQGDIAVSSAVGIGTTFTLHFPLIDPPKEEEKKTINLDAELEKKTDITNKHILVVDDNPINISLVKKILSKSHANPECYSKPLEICEKYKSIQESNPFDVILMDLEMPDMNGYELTEKIIEIHETSKLSEVPIIALTAHQDDATEKKVKELGMIDILHKPINKIDLLKKISLYC